MDDTDEFILGSCISPINSSDSSIQSIDSTHFSKKEFKRRKLFSFDTDSSSMVILQLKSVRTI